MSSTNKTPNYQLSQFIATDKPAWLTDVNGDMSKIDAAIKGIADRVGVNETAITEAEANIEDNASNITALQATSSQHGTDITDLKAQDIIIKNDVTNLGTRVTVLENGNVDLLWTNSNPTSPISTLTILKDLTPYKYFIVAFNIRGTYAVRFNAIFTPSTIKGIASCIDFSSSTLQLLARPFVFNDNSITIQNAYKFPNNSTSANDSDALIPIEIYGIR